MKILSITLKNPEIESKRVEITSNGIINKNIEEMVLDIKRKLKDTSKAVQTIKEKYASSDDIVDIIDSPYNWQSYISIEEKLASYNECQIIALPDMTSSIFAIYKNSLTIHKNIPLLYFIDDYIDLLYSLYSYLLF